MKTLRQYIGFPQKIMALAVLAALNPAHAEDDAAAQLIKPDHAAVSVGIGAVDGDSRDRALFGQYNGMRDDSTRLLLDIDYLRRNDTSGTWTILNGRDLGLDTRELNFSQEKQGNWKYSGEYSELVRTDPRTVNTALQGVNTTTPTVIRLATPGTGSDLDLRTKRESIKLGVNKWITPSLQFEVNFKNEDKNGTRLFGRGYDCSAAVCAGTSSATSQKSAFLLLPEPINATTKQIDAKLNFSGDKFFISGGYYGSFYVNDNGNSSPSVPNVLNNGSFTSLGSATLFPAAVGGTSLQNVLQMPLALAPDNQAQQLYLSGNYAFTPSTKATFKYAYTHATQDDDFLGKGLTGAPAGRGDLGAVVDTNLAQVGLTARPIDKLALLANLRYVDKNDKTPIDRYNFNGTTRWTNNRDSNRKLNGKLEASYRLSDQYRATLGADYEAIDRDRLISTSQVSGVTALREKTDETGYRLELRRSMSEKLNGSISYISTKRDGSNWLLLNGGALTGIRGEASDNTVFASTGASTLGRYLSTFPFMLMDRKRDKVRLSADWTPTERFSLQFVGEDGKDKYTAPTEKGLQDSGMHLYSLDASFALSDAWKLTGYISRGNQTTRQARNTDYSAELENTNTTAGFGVFGKATGNLDLGANLSYTNDVNRYGLTPDTASTAATIAQIGFGLPDVTFRQTMLNLFAKYTLTKNADLRVNLVHQRTKFDEWTWGHDGVPFVYSDGTTVNMRQDQSVTFLGVSYIYKF